MWIMWDPRGWSVPSIALVHSTCETESQWLTGAAAGVQEKGEAKRYSFNSTFPSLPSVMKARKRREDARKTEDT